MISRACGNPFLCVHKCYSFPASGNFCCLLITFGVQARQNGSKMLDSLSIFLKVLFVCFDALHPSQQFFSHVGAISCLPE